MTGRMAESPSPACNDSRSRQQEPLSTDLGLLVVAWNLPVAHADHTPLER